MGREEQVEQAVKTLRPIFKRIDALREELELLQVAVHKVMDTLLGEEVED